MTRTDGEPKKVSLGLLVILILSIIAIWVIAGFILSGLSDRGTFGDMFGSINALFAGLAFAGIIYAIVLQRRDLELQRKELQLTREELEGQKQQLFAQNDTLKRQAFQGTFFQLLEFHNNIVKSLRIYYELPGANEIRVAERNPRSRKKAHRSSWNKRRPNNHFRKPH